MEYNNFKNEDCGLDISIIFYRDSETDKNGVIKYKNNIYFNASIDNEILFSELTTDYSKEDLAGEIANAYIWRQDKELIKKELINILPETLEII